MAVGISAEVLFLDEGGHNVHYVVDSWIDFLDESFQGRLVGI